MSQRKLFTGLLFAFSSDLDAHSGGSAWCAAADVSYRGGRGTASSVGIGMVGGLIVGRGADAAASDFSAA